MKKIYELFEEGKEVAKSGINTVNDMLSNKIDVVNLRAQFAKNEKRIKELYTDVGMILSDSIINDNDSIAEQGIIRINEFSIVRISTITEEIKRLTKENEGINFFIDSINKKSQTSKDEKNDSDEDSENNAIFCTSCGKEAEEEDVFCRRCGTKLKK